MFTYYLFSNMTRLVIDLNVIILLSENSKEMYISYNLNKISNNNDK